MVHLIFVTLFIAAGPALLETVATAGDEVEPLDAAGAKGKAASPLQQAKAHFKMGSAHYEAGSYDLAIAEYEAAYNHDPRPETLFNIGQCHRLLGHRELALHLYKGYLAAHPNGDAADEARRYVAQLTHELRDAGTATPPAAPAGKAPDGIAGPARSAQPARVDLTPSTKPAPPAPALPLVPTPAAVPASGAAVQTGARDSAARPVYKKAWFWAVVGGAAAVVAAGVATGVALSAEPTFPTPSLGTIPFEVK